MKNKELGELSLYFSLMALTISAITLLVAIFGANGLVLEAGE